VQIEDRTDFEVLNVLRVIRCLDESRSEFVNGPRRIIVRIWPASIDRSPDCTSMFLAFPTNAHLFRIEHWLIALVVSDEVRAAMEKAGCFGARFQDVT